ncbi:ABC transporter substrate-binding protein [Nocardia carnea]|uniref:ABC transporter substrate-binding protein n=1 Tax=Nocardia carnea TaxID=37328 RepID=UPI00245786D3|nr:ABC transporter substrate-binding protein [Nocardia carnea]
MTTLIQPPPPGYRKWWWIPAALLLVALIVVAVIWLPEHFRTDNSCGDGVVRAEESGECVGVTDGSVRFSDELGDIEQRILAQNTAVANSGEPYVSIVLLTPMTSGNNDEGNVTTAGIQHRLAGAHLAQLAANETSIWKRTPKIRLLLANPGVDFAAWPTVVEQIEARRAAERIVAVTGISFSFQNALDAIAELTRLGMPVIGSTLTVDDLPPWRGFLKVSPPASEHARAAAEFLAGSNDRILMVRDDSPADQYGRTLAEAFRSRFPDDPQRLVPRPETFDSEAGDVSIAFHLMMPNICRLAPGTIYFAGRGADALEFLTALATRPCNDTPIQVVTADDMPYYQLAEVPAGKALETGVRVLYTGLVHPQAWADQPDRFNRFSVEQFSPDCPGPICYKDFSDGNLDDFAAIMEHDAVVTAVQAIRNAAAYVGEIVDSGPVLQAMKGLHSDRKFLAAGGTLSFDEHGLPMDKPIPILEAKLGAPPEYIGLP